MLGLGNHLDGDVARVNGVVGDGTVHVVHVTLEPFSAEGDKALLKKLVDVLPPDAERKARVMVHVLHGNVASEILTANDRFGVDVICLGAKTQTKLHSPIADEVLKHTRRPVMFASPVNP